MLTGRSLWNVHEHISGKASGRIDRCGMQVASRQMVACQNGSPGDWIRELTFSANKAICFLALSQTC